MRATLISLSSASSASSASSLQDQALWVICDEMLQHAQTHKAEQ